MNLLEWKKKLQIGNKNSKLETNFSKIGNKQTKHQNWDQNIEKLGASEKNIKIGIKISKIRDKTSNF